MKSSSHEITIINIGIFGQIQKASTDKDRFKRLNQQYPNIYAKESLLIPSHSILKERNKETRQERAEECTHN
jgi:hypothetical protein